LIIKYDYIIVGSGFGGSVSAYRLSQKGYSVLVIEKGKRWESKDFPKTNWNLKKWLWLPSARFFGIFKLSFLSHVGILSGVGVGGGSLVYANTLPVPQKAFFSSGSWAGLQNWEQELSPFYTEAKRMLGAAKNPVLGQSDKILEKIAIKNGLQNQFSATDVAVFFGKPNQEVSDPYFKGKGPNRTGCNFCGACMTGCRFNAKNTLDKNYLFLAEQNGVEVLPELEVVDIIPKDENGEGGYQVITKSSTSIFNKSETFESQNLILSGGVLGTVKLLLNLKKRTLPNLSDRLGEMVRTNNESLIGIVSSKSDVNLTEGVAIGSILHTDENSHLEPVRYGKGSGFWRLLMLPLAPGKNVLTRLTKTIFELVKHPIAYAKILSKGKFAERSAVLLFMQTLNSTLSLKSSFWGMNSMVKNGEKPAAFIPEAVKFANEYSEEVKGKPMVVLTETILGIPTTAHILGGCVIGADSSHGVINHKHQIFGYKNMMVCDGSAISANPGVNPSLTITAMTERAMSFIPEKKL
jgi:cholesterol oxidase